jgi:hypothetical protein
VELTVVDECRWIALVIVLLSLRAVIERVRRGTLLTAVGGLHINLMLFYGIGLFYYTLPFPSTGLAATISDHDRNHQRLIEAITIGGWPMCVGYLAAVIFDVRMQRRRSAADAPEPPKREDMRLTVLMGLAIAAALGYLGSLYEFSQSGLGTVFPLLKTTLYPATMLAVWVVSRKRPLTWGPFLFALGFAAFVALFSPWRSELIFLAGAVGLGLFLRHRKLLLPIATLLFGLLIMLPFAHAKKLRFEEVRQDPVGQFAGTLDLSLEERLDFLARFWSLRINGARELGYVVDGLRAGRIQVRDGETYWEAVQQLVPRVLWREKPEFNRVANFKLARDVGLVSKGDKTTSWGVNLYAEAVWNFGTFALLLFLPLFTFGAWLIDRLAARLRDPSTATVVSSTLFFQFLTAVGLVTMVTFLLWLFLFGFLLDRLLRSGPAAPVLQPAAMTE